MREIRGVGNKIYVRSGMKYPEGNVRDPSWSD